MLYIVNYFFYLGLLRVTIVIPLLKLSILYESTYLLCFNTSVVASDSETAEILIEEEFDSRNGRSYVLEVPAAKWALVSAILCSYVKKFVSLYECQESRNIFLIDERTLRGIEKSINKKQSNLELAKKIAEQLKDFKESDD